MANDNRVPAGVLRNGVLTLRLVAQDGLLFPDGESGASLVMQAFGEEGKAPTAAAPLIRVPVWLNGSAEPLPITFDVGRMYRLRLINITPGSDGVVALLADSVVQQWRGIAKDGATLPEWQATMRAATVGMGPGETNDFEFTPSVPGDLVLETRFGRRKVRQRIVVQRAP